MSRAHLSGLTWSAQVHSAAQPAAARARQAQPDQRMAAASPRVERVGHPNSTPVPLRQARRRWRPTGSTRWASPCRTASTWQARPARSAVRPMRGRAPRQAVAHSAERPALPGTKCWATRFVDPEAVPSWDRSDVCGVEGTFSWCFGASCCLTPGARVGGTDFILDLASGAVTSAKLDEAGAREHLVCCAELYAQARRRPDLKQSGERLELDGRLGSEDAGSRR